MLESLVIKNVVLIKEETVSFTEGLNIISGETGAGKSILLNSLNFLLGGKASTDFIRTGEDSAEVQGLLFFKEDKVLQSIIDMGIEVDEDRMILITRTISKNSKNICRVNGKQVPLNIIKEIGSKVIDFHSQRENQILLDTKKHIEILDSFCGDEIVEKKQKLSEKFLLYKEIEKEIGKLNIDEREKAFKMDMLSFQIKEIGQADLKKGEDVDLAETKKILANSEKIKRNIFNVLNLLYDGENSAYDGLSRATSLLDDISEFDKENKSFYDSVLDISSRLEDEVRNIRTYYNNIDDDDLKLEGIEERLNLIYTLKKKYGNTIEEILKFYDDAVVEYDVYEKSEEEIKKLTEKLMKLEKECLEICDQIEKIRILNAKKIESSISENMLTLGMKEAGFKIEVGTKEKMSGDGKNTVTFLISTNKGEPYKPLSKIASGGEMSRVMLAMKIVLADTYMYETFVFDEIDTGVSGRTAQMVGEKLYQLGNSKQILCITHLPQIAAMGDSHILLKKSTIEDETISTIKNSNEDESIGELARLIGGAKITESTLLAASEMKDMANKLKSNTLQ